MICDCRKYTRATLIDDVIHTYIRMYVYNWSVLAIQRHPTHAKKRSKKKPFLSFVCSELNYTLSFCLLHISVTEAWALLFLVVINSNRNLSKIRISTQAEMDINYIFIFPSYSLTPTIFEYSIWNIAKKLYEYTVLKTVFI